MMKTALFAVAAVILLYTRSSSEPAAAPAPAAATSYAIDNVHSSMVFRVRFSGMSDFYGRFNKFSGKIEFDEDRPEALEVEVEVEAASVDTGNERRDGHLRSNDFFGAKQNPKITFKSKSVKKLSDGEFEVKGDFMLRGTTKEATAKISYGGKQAGARGETRVGFSGALTIDRTDFGVSFGEGRIGSKVTVLLGISATAVN